jgi:hypothetical protein
MATRFRIEDLPEAPPGSADELAEIARLITGSDESLPTGTGRDRQR